MNAKRAISVRTPALPARIAFLHVVNDYRWLAASGYVWEACRSGDVLGGNAVPHLDVLAQGSVLVHARSLIEFYTKGPGKAYLDDIIVEDFGLAVSPDVRAKLLHQEAISVHLLHLTAWRDVDYREREKNSDRGSKRQWPEWNLSIPDLMASVFEALDDAASQEGPWQQPLRRLHSACVAALDDPRLNRWPAELTEKEDIDAYLRGLGL